MAAKEHSFVLKRGEGLHDKSLIKHTVLNVEAQATPRASTAESTLKTTTPVQDAVPAPVNKSSYVSPMARARQLAKQRREQASDSTSTGASKDWDETSTESAVSSVSNGAGTTPPPVRRIPYSGGLIPSSGGLIPSSGYIPKSGTVNGDDGGRLPKFGVWDNHNDENGPCYTLLFESVAQEKRTGGPVRIHADQPSCSPPPSEDLYKFNPPTLKTARKARQYHGLLCCFIGS